MSARSAPVLRAARHYVLSNETAVCGGRRLYSYNAIPCKRTVTTSFKSRLLTPLRRSGSGCYARGQSIHSQTRSISSASVKHRVYIALGSNLGDRIHMIEQACNLLDKHDEIRIVRTSCLWETKAMYVEDQADFLNGACEIETSLEPIELLDELQRIEKALHRVKLVDKGPRTIDLDILLYDDRAILHERLQVPHKLMLERAFVLEPLAEMIPDHIIPTDSTNTTIQQHLLNLPPSSRPLTTVTPLSPNAQPLKSLLSARPTQIMSIINLTPDSFSDGGLNTPQSLPAVTSSHITSGATILDIGGYSTRPNATVVSTDDEFARTIPAIRTISSHLAETTTPGANTNVSISIDTFRASVAHAAITAGAHIINDVSAGQLDPDMLPTAASLGCTIILMHMRGDPSTMSSPTHTSYPAGLIPTVAAELAARVAEAEAAGVRRWRIMLDPGLGFSKTLEQNLELVRRMPELRAVKELRGLPWLVGASRKGFVGKVTGVQVAKERGWGTAGVVAASVWGGADVVRVHDVKEMKAVVDIADAVWRV